MPTHWSSAGTQAHIYPAAQTIPRQAVWAIPLHSFAVAEQLVQRPLVPLPLLLGAGCVHPPAWRLLDWAEQRLPLAWGQH